VSGKAEEMVPETWPTQVLRPFETGLSEGKKILARLDATHIHIGPKADNMILQLRYAACGDDLTTRVTQKSQIVGSFFAPNG